MTGEEIHYEQLAQDALRGVVKEVLTRAEQDGLPGDHHFYIAFDTQAEGVNISKRLKEQYPEEMTVVLQHQFWDLKVSETQFQIKLSFNNIPETLIVPFSAIKVFFDPSVPYGLQFGAAAEFAHDDSHTVLALPEVINDTDEQPSLLPPASIAGLSAIDETVEPAPKEDVEKTANDEDGGSAKVVELDSFRKK